MFISAYIRISWVGSYLSWTLHRTWGLISKTWNTNSKSVRQVDFSQKLQYFFQNLSKNPSLPFYQNSVQLYLADRVWFVNETTKSCLVSKELVQLIAKDLTMWHWQQKIWKCEINNILIIKSKKTQIVFKKYLW